MANIRSLRLLTALFSAAASSHLAPAQAADLTFGTPQRIVGNPAADAEPPQVAVGGSKAYLAWHEFPIQSIPGNGSPTYSSRAAPTAGGRSARE